MTVYFDMPPGYNKMMWPDMASAHQWNYSGSTYAPSSASSTSSYWGHEWDKHSYDGSYSAASSARGRASSWGELSVLPDEPDGIFVINSLSSGAYASLVADASTADIVAIDAEWVPDFNWGSDNPISVIQLAFPESRRVYVIQLGPLGGKPPQAVQMMLVNPEVTKVGFATDQKDTAKFRSTGISVMPGSLYDVQSRCGTALGMDWSSAQSLSLKRAAHEILGIVLNKDKRCACSDWSAEKLTEEQVHYAALDAWIALKLYYAVA